MLIHMYRWIVILIVLLLLEEILRRLKPVIKGTSGEAMVSLVLSGLPKEEYTVLHNVMLRTDRGTSQVDHVVVSVYGIFAIEVKNYTGWITGTETSSQWTQTIYRKKSHFMNPIHQNYGHVKAIEALLQDPSIPIFSIVTFPGDASLKVKLDQANVVKWGALKDTIRKLSVEKVMDSARMSQIVSLLQDRNVDNADTRKEHIKEINQKKASIAEGVCPRCGGRLIVRHGRYGDFLGCSNYPACSYTKKIEQ
jgi:uncharacterized protein YbaA (DUF1428 family)